MNRLIKFRAYDKKEKKWLFGYETLGGFSMFGELHVMDEINGLDALNDIEVTQFTGLTDKNGKEIYDGDIYRNRKGEDSVIFDFIRDTFHLEQYVLMGGDVSVVGNIYENHELVK